MALPIAGALILAGCSGGGGGGGGATGGGEATGGGGEEPAAGFSIMVSQANDADDYWAEYAAAYTEETGTEVEVIPYPGDAYNTQVTTQLQAGNAADMMILSPGTGQAISVITLAEADFLEPLNEASAGVIPAGSEGQYELDGEIYAQPATLAPVGLIWNPTGAASVGIDEFPTTYEDLLEACATAREGGKSLIVFGGAFPPNAGLMSQLISATRVYAETPDWNEQRAAGDVTFADSGWREVLEDIVQLNEEGCFQDGAEGGVIDSITQGMGGQTSLATAAPGSAAASIGAAAGVELNVQAFPPAEGQEPFTVTSANYAWAVNAASDDAVKASAQEFLDWAGTPEQTAAFAELSGFVDILSPTENLAPAYEPIGELLETGAFVGLPNSSWPNPAIYDALGVGVQGLLTGQKTVDQVLEEMDAAWDQ